MARQKTDPESLVKAIKASGYRVERRLHGWLCFPADTSLPAEWISRNVGGRGQKNNEAVAKRLIGN